MKHYLWERNFSFASPWGVKLGDSGDGYGTLGIKVGRVHRSLDPSIFDVEPSQSMRYCSFCSLCR